MGPFWIHLGRREEWFQATFANWDCFAPLHSCTLCLGDLLADRFLDDSNRDDNHLGCEKGGPESQDE